MNANISIFVICVGAIIYLLLHDLHGCISNSSFKKKININAAQSVCSLFMLLVLVSTCSGGRFGLNCQSAF